MSDANTSANGNPKAWTPEEEFDLVMATLHQQSNFAALPYEAVATMLQKKYPTKNKEACRKKFQKLKLAYLAKFEVGAADVPAGPTNVKGNRTPKTPRKRAVAEAAAEDDDEEETPSAKKRRPAVKQSFLKKAAAKKQEQVVDAPEEDPEEDMEV